jgi:hypothetical protein
MYMGGGASTPLAGSIVKDANKKKISVHILSWKGISHYLIQIHLGSGHSLQKIT